jgi:hypothetical protein
MRSKCNNAKTSLVSTDGLFNDIILSGPLYEYLHTICVPKRGNNLESYVVDWKEQGWARTVVIYYDNNVR